MTEIRKLLRHRGAQAGVGVVLAAGVVATAGVAGAAQDETITAPTDAGGLWDKPAVTIQTGDTVTWSFVGSGHNVESTNGNPGTGATKDPRWEAWSYPPGAFQIAPKGSQTTYTFYKSGTYNFLCVFHGGMTGTITVEGADLPLPTDPTPTPTPTATATNDPDPQPTTSPQPTVSPQPTPDDHTNTPAPGGAAADKTKPAISGVKLRGLKRAARVRFRLSENATVTLQFRKRGSKRVIRTVRLQARAGTRTVTVRSKKLRKGRYTVTLRARDAMGNRSASRRAALRIRR